MQQSIFIGLDLGSTRCQQTAVHADGSVSFSRSLPTCELQLRSAFSALWGNVRVHLEARALAAWAHSIIKPLVSEVVISHPRTLAWIAKDSNKTDAVDARKLADLLRLNLGHPVYYEQSDARRTFKQLVVHHEQLARDQARLKSKIKARLRCVGIIRTDAGLFSASGQAALLDQFREAFQKAIFIQLFAVLNQMLDSLSQARQAMSEFSPRFPEVQLLQTAPGVGIITACRFVA